MANSLTTTYRNLLKNKSFLLINVFGLAVAIGSSIIILLYSRYELSYDSYHENADRIQLVIKERNTAQGIRELRDTWVPLLGTMQNRYSEIIDGVRIGFQNGWIETEGLKFQDTITIADPSLFDVFSFSLATGDQVTALDGISGVVLSQDTARRYFGDEDPLGKRITWNFEQDFLVTGVLNEYPKNSTVVPDLIVPFESFIPPDGAEANANWGSSFLFTYLLLDEDVSVATLEGQFPAMVESLFGQEGPNGVQNMNLRLWSLDSLHDRSEDSDFVAYTLLAIAFAIIFISCVNFMNLATARSMERGREVGVRKTLGAARTQLAMQFFVEAMSISALAMIAGVILARALLPVFNALFNLQLQLNLFTDLPVLISLLLVGLAAGSLSGAYPAVFMSGFGITDSLRGKLKIGKQGVLIRSTLSVLQFSLALILSIGLVVIWQQIQFMKNSELNFDAENIVVIPTSLRDFPEAELAASRVQAFKQEALLIPGVRTVTSSMSIPGNYQNSNVFATPQDWQEPEPLRMIIAGADDFYFQTFDMKFIEGRDFDRDFATERNSIILNETAMRDMGWDSAVGKRVNDNWTVVGVVEDFHYQSLENDIRAIIHIYGPQDSRNHNFISLKLDTPDTQAVITTLEQNWRQLDLTRPFSYFFIEDSIDDLYRNVDNISTIIGYFCLLSLFIANLGLLGLVSYSVVQRTKEIGIRKVMGASVTSILALLSLQFTRPVFFANLIAWPIAYLVISLWLQGFAYRIDMSWMVFLLAGIVVLVLAIATVCMQSFRTARSNPVEALRYE